MKAAQSSVVGGAARRFVEWTARRRLLILAVALVLGAAGALRTAKSYAALRGDLEELLPASAPSVAALGAMRARMAGMRFLGVVVDTGGPANVPKAVEFVDALASRIRAYPPELVGSVRVGFDEEREFIETYALQLMDPEDVRVLREAVERRRDREVAHAAGWSVIDEADDPRPEISFEKLRAKYIDRIGQAASRPSDRFVSEDDRTVVLLVQAVSHETSYEVDRTLLARVRTDVTALGFPDAYAPGMRIGWAGDVATRVEMMEGLVADISIAGLLAAALVLGAVGWYFRTAWALLVLGVPLLLGTLGTFGIVALPPLRIDHLNSNTAFFGSVVLGNGINSGIILLARHLEERRRGAGPLDAIAVALGASVRPTLAAAAASGAAYGALVWTDFRGFSQFGWIGAVGMLACWAANMLLVPLLCIVLGRRLGGASGRAPRERLTTRAIFAAHAHPRLVLALGAALGLAAVGGLWQRGADWLEHDFSKLRSRQSFVRGERYWGARMDATLGQYLTPTVVLATSAERAREVAERLRSLAEAKGAGDLIASVRTVDLVLPPRRSDALVEARRIEQALTQRMRKELEPDEQARVARALSPRALRRLEPADVPATLMAGFLERDGSVDRTVLVFPRLSSATWEGPRLAAYARDIRAAVAPADAGASVSGSLLLSADLTDAMGRDGPLAAALGLGAAFVICAFAFGSVRLSLAAMAAVVGGVVLMMGGLAWTGAKLNFSNFVALPITFGIAADYAINVLRRYQAEGTMEARQAIATTAGAVAMCSATTIIGFGSLLAADSRALFSFGLFAATGEVTTLLTASILLPVAVGWLDRRRRPALPVAGSPPSAHPGRSGRSCKVGASVRDVRPRLP